MDYTKITVGTEGQEAELLMSRLEDLGITGFVVEDPQDIQELLKKKNSYDWDYVDEQVLARQNTAPSISFYLPDDPAGMELLERAIDELQYLGVEKVEISGTREEDWKDKWKEYFKPARITERITVKPSWEAYEKQAPEELVIEIDPGMAFGTGLHPTTTLCMRFMERYIVPGQSSLLDIGCGSGILSIGGALLGAREVLGVELDPVAVQVAKENVMINHLPVPVEIREGDLVQGVSMQADVVVANLMTELVVFLSEQVAGSMEKDGVFISSGILVEKEEVVTAALQQNGFRILDIMEEGEWCAIAACVER